MSDGSTSSPAEIHAVLRNINQVCQQKGGKYAQYSCKTVSWDDAHRGTIGGSLSCWGANITDTRLYAKDGRRLFTVRPDNWNEKLGTGLSTEDICLVVGNEIPGRDERRPILLSEFLAEAGTKYGCYCGLTPENCPTLESILLDGEVSVRYQTTFLPVPERGRESTAALEFATEAYNYNTTSDADPKNLFLLCTSQGFALQQDGAGAKKLFHHSVHNVPDGGSNIVRHWLEAERAEKHAVGGAQHETEREKQAAAARGKATPSVIGPECMGTRFNCLMTIQIPLQMRMQTQHPPPASDVPMFKLLLVGDSGVGKSSFLQRHLNGSFEKKYVATLGADVHRLTFHTNRGQIEFEVWDTAGQERYGGLRNGYYINASGALIMFDVENRVSYKNAQDWYGDVIRVCGEIPIVMCRNKVDLLDSTTKRKKTSFFRTKSLQHFNISAKLGFNLEKPMLYLARKLVKDNTLHFVEAPALCPPEFTVDDEVKAMYEQDLAQAACQPMPDEDSDEDNNVLHCGLGIDTFFSEKRRTPEAAGISNAARVSVGSVFDTNWKGLEAIISTPSEVRLKRHPHQRISVTVILYYTVVGGVPSTDDILRAIDDLESLYDASSPAMLTSTATNFMKSELTVQNMLDIHAKVTLQPPYQFGAPVTDANVFPNKRQTNNRTNRAQN